MCRRGDGSYRTPPPRSSPTSSALASLRQRGRRWPSLASFMLSRAALLELEIGLLGHAVKPEGRSRKARTGDVFLLPRRRGRRRVGRSRSRSAVRRCQWNGSRFYRRAMPETGCRGTAGIGTTDPASSAPPWKMPWTRKRGPPLQLCQPSVLLTIRQGEAPSARLLRSDPQKTDRYGRSQEPCRAPAGRGPGT